MDADTGQMNASASQGVALATPAALALPQRDQAQRALAAPADSLVKRVLRFLAGGFLRRGQPHASAAGAPAGAQLQLQPSCSVAGASEVSDAVLLTTPFASIEDMQAYRSRLQQQQEQRQEQQQQQARSHGAPGPLRRAARWLVHHFRGAARHFRPQGVGPNDAQIGERIANVLTSVPFILIGASILRGATTAAGRQSGASFIGCGVVAALYHSAPPGAARRALRKLDYWSICYTSGVLRSAAGLRAPAALRAVAALATPVKPTLVTGANLIAIEARYLWYALRHAQLRKAFATHVGAAAAGVACFLADDVLVLERGCPPVFHPCWHVLSSVSLGLVGPLLTHCEGTLLLEGVQALVAA